MYNEANSEDSFKFIVLMKRQREREKEREREKDGKKLRETRRRLSAVLDTRGKPLVSN